MHYRVDIPENATEVVDSRHQNGQREKCSYFQHGKLVGHRLWTESGLLEHEYGCRDGRRQGYELLYHKTGNLMAAIPWSRGVLSGMGRQWSRDGRLIVEWTVATGTGVELICSALVGHEHGEYMSAGEGDPVLSIERHWVDGKRSGVERWWAGDNLHITDEMYFRDDGPHGIWRSWTARGTQRRGYPRYFINGQKLSKQAYLRRAARDETLPPFRPEDNAPIRPMPGEFLRYLHKL